VDHSTNLAQHAADAIKRRREVAADLRLVAELVEDGLPVPLAVRPWVDGLQIQVDSDHVGEWLDRIVKIPIYQWTPSPHGDGEHLDVTTNHLGTPLKIVAFRRAVSEVTC
jgi:hypothetical protein